MAVVFNTIIGTLMVLPPSSDIENLLDYFSFAMWTIYALTFISIIILRYTEPYKSIERPFKVNYFQILEKMLLFFTGKFKVWLPLPIICAAISIYLVIAPLVDNWSNAYLLAMLIIAAGLIFYIPFVWLDWTLPWGLFEKLEIICQKYFEVVPVSADQLKNE